MTYQDSETPIAALKALVSAFHQERHWGRFHSPKNLAMSIAIEAAELMELFQWVEGEQAAILAGDEPLRGRVAEELADVLIYCLTLAAKLDLDVSTLVADKMDANGRKYPLDAVRGRADLASPYPQDEP